MGKRDADNNLKPTNANVCKVSLQPYKEERNSVQACSYNIPTGIVLYHIENNQRISDSIIMLSSYIQTKVELFAESQQGDTEESRNNGNTSVSTKRDSSIGAIASGRCGRCTTVGRSVARRATGGSSTSGISGDSKAGNTATEGSGSASRMGSYTAQVWSRNSGHGRRSGECLCCRLESLKSVTG